MVKAAVIGSFGGHPWPYVRTVRGTVSRLHMYAAYRQSGLPVDHSAVMPEGRMDKDESMAPKIFIDGQEGTTGLKIRDRLINRPDLQLLEIEPEKRKDAAARKELLAAADVAVLCLPDAAAKEAVALVGDGDTKIIDASTAHRTDAAWAYGLPELNAGQRGKIAESSRVAVPGCHATGFALGLYPLVKQGIVPAGYPVTCTSITGYSGGGKKLIAFYEDTPKPGLEAPRPYALGLAHKHLPEMRHVCGLKREPHFMPILGNFYRGMTVSVPLHAYLLQKRLSAREIHGVLAEWYAGETFVKVMPFGDDTLLDNGAFMAMGCNGTNRAEVFVFGHGEQAVVMTRLDNLGKGASGAAVQNLNIVLGLDETEGLL